MKNLLSAILASLVFLAPAASAQFNKSQTPTQLQSEIAAQAAAGKSLADIAKAPIAIPAVQALAVDQPARVNY